MALADFAAAEGIELESDAPAEEKKSESDTTQGTMGPSESA